ncbi:ATP-dependent DNA helicase Q5-like [Copidosoma floridanum]|uniref:ATP-dependent DNA helicase Q5-like n=1 Tax=Copidosoma floridanum TaxID=29053 RepID=UPI0006C9DF59|nr:ATP-dependent DNA helicase Q5-like [Copidosoma floridanum]
MAATIQLMYSELQNKFGLTDFKSESQKEVTKHVYEDALIEQRDVFINMPSGFGKSLCFQLPVLSKDYAFAIVITPTIALATHQVDYLRSKNIMAYCWNAYTPNSIKYIIKKDLIKKKPKIKFLYISPEQCQSLHFQVIMAKVNLRVSYYFVIDEAHCVSPSSHNFRKCYQSLDRIRTKYPHVPILAMSSTITKKVTLFYNQLNIVNCV